MLVTRYLVTESTSVPLPRTPNVNGSKMGVHQSSSFDLHRRTTEPRGVTTSWYAAIWSRACLRAATHVQSDWTRAKMSQPRTERPESLTNNQLRCAWASGFTLNWPIYRRASSNLWAVTRVAPQNPHCKGAAKGPGSEDEGRRGPLLLKRCGTRVLPPSPKGCLPVNHTPTTTNIYGFSTRSRSSETNDSAHDSSAVGEDAASCPHLSFEVLLLRC